MDRHDRSAVRGSGDHVSVRREVARPLSPHTAIMPITAAWQSTRNEGLPMRLVDERFSWP